MEDRYTRDSLDDPMQQALNQKGAFVVLASIDQDGFPSAIPVGSLVARGSNDLAFCLRVGLRSLENIRERPEVAFLYLGPAQAMTIKGRATVGEEIPGSRERFGRPAIAVHVRVTEVRTVGGGVRTAPFVYWTWEGRGLEAFTHVRSYLARTLFPGW